MKTALWDDLHVSRSKAEQLEARLRRQAVEDEVGPAWKGKFCPACPRIEIYRGSNGSQYLVAGRTEQYSLGARALLVFVLIPLNGAQYLQYAHLTKWCPLASSGSRTSALTEKESKNGRKTSSRPRKTPPGSASTSRDR